MLNKSNMHVTIFLGLECMR